MKSKRLSKHSRTISENVADTMSMVSDRPHMKFVNCLQLSVTRKHKTSNRPSMEPVSQLSRLLYQFKVTGDEDLVHTFVAEKDRVNENK